MNGRRVLGGLIAAALLLGVLLSYGAEAQEPQPPADPGKFKGKVTVFYVHGSIEGSVMIRDAKFERVRDRWFVTGTAPDVGDQNDWTRDTHAAVDWDRVESFYVFTEEQFQQQVFADPGAI